MKTKICDKCKKYTFDEKCKKCGKPVKDAHYKFLKFEKRKSEENSI